VPAAPTPVSPTASPAAGGDAAALLRATRALSTSAAVCLAVQLFGNLYEEVVGNVATLADPRPGALVGALAPGSPVYFYLPWAPLGVVLAAVLAVRLRRLDAPAWVVRRMHVALGALAVAVAAKVVLVTTINPRFRDPGATVELLRRSAVTWAFGNGIAIVAVAVALVLLLSWRAAVLDPAPRGKAGLERACMRAGAAS
jgi:F0F1-type ATP synthase membrane subunit c/vacuolar-type H+-ATPase subunit K